MAQSVAGGLTLGLGLVLLCAGALKWRRGASFEVALIALLPARIWAGGRVSSRTLRRVVLAVEAGFGALLVWSAGRSITVVEVATVVFFAGLLAIVLSAWRRDVPCGCSGSARHAATPRDVVRGVILLSAAALASALDLSAGSSTASASVGIEMVIALAFLLAVALTSQAIPGVRAASASVVSVVEHVPTAEHRVSRRTVLRGAVGGLAALLLGRAVARPDDADAGLYTVVTLVFCGLLLEICAANCAYFEGSVGSCLNCCDNCWLKCNDPLTGGYPGCPGGSCFGYWSPT